MSAEIARIVVMSLENVLQSVNVPILAAEQINNEEIQRSLANLCALMCGELDYKIMPLIHAAFPELKPEATSR